MCYRVPDFEKVIVSPDNIEFIIKELISEKNSSFRTAYLTKEQIEAEGWTYIQDDFLVNVLKRVPTHYWFVKNGYGCTLYPDKNIIAIEDNRTHMMIQPRFYDGPCPSINEFRTICKLLNID